MAEYRSEFRHLIDDAWYSVRMESSGEMFTVKYKDFTEEEDSVFEASSFTSLPELHGFRNRFRPLSPQLQDNECHLVFPGIPVCASHSFDAQDVRFYDAVIDDVVHKPHGVGENGEDECLCDFILLWSHGPRSKYCDTKKIDSLCLVQSNGVLDPKVEAFVSLVKGKLAASSTAPKLQSLPMKPKSTFAQSLAQRTKCAKRSSPLATCPVEEVERGSSCTEGEGSYFGVDSNHCTGVRGEDGDFGGGSQRFGLLIDNLDKNLSPSAIVEFIHAQTSFCVQAYVFLSFPYETYTKGAIVLDCEKNLEKLCKFLGSPDHVVVSRDGRPWVVSGKLSQFNTFIGPMHALILKYQNKLHDKSLGIKFNDLKLVCSGSEEYTTAEQRRYLFKEFVEHQRLMHRSLALEERAIRSRAVEEARAMLSHDLENKAKTLHEPVSSRIALSTSKEILDLPREQSLSVPSRQENESLPIKTSGAQDASLVETETSSNEDAPLNAATDVETEKHPVQSTEIQIIDKAVVEEEPVNETKHRQLSSSSSSKG